MQDHALLKVVTRTFFEGTAFDDRGNSRDTRYLTRDDLCTYLRDLVRDAYDYGVHGTVNVNGKAYASFERSAYSPIPRCPQCRARHLSPCLNEPVSAVETLGQATEYQAPQVFRGATFTATELPETSPDELNVGAAGYALTGVHDCPCCSEHIYSDTLLCAECITAGCEANREGAYDDCQRPCEACGDPHLSDYYVCVVWNHPGQDVTYSDGYVCADHLPNEADMAGSFVPGDAEIHEVTVNELPGRGE